MFENIVNKLNLLQSKYGLVGIKCELESEGVRQEELLWTLNVIRKEIFVPVYLKLGGCEAKSDLLISHSYGVDGIVAPMVESEFACEKFVKMIEYEPPYMSKRKKLYGINIETKQAYENVEKIIKRGSGSLDFITVGRVDLVGSYGLGRSAIDSNDINEIVTSIFKAAKKMNLMTTLGGGVGFTSIPFLKELNSMKLINRFETRKLIFNIDSTELGNELFKEAIEFELLWLKYKATNYKQYSVEDQHRICMLEDRLNLTNDR